MSLPNLSRLGETAGTHIGAPIRGLLLYPESQSSTHNGAQMHTGKGGGGVRAVVQFSDREDGSVSIAQSGLQSPNSPCVSIVTQRSTVEFSLPLFASRFSQGHILTRTLYKNSTAHFQRITRKIATNRA